MSTARGCFQVTSSCSQSIIAGGAEGREPGVGWLQAFGPPWSPLSSQHVHSKISNWEYRLLPSLAKQLPYSPFPQLSAYSQWWHLHVTSCWPAVKLFGNRFLLEAVTSFAKKIKKLGVNKHWMLRRKYGKNLKYKTCTLSATLSVKSGVFLKYQHYWRHSSERTPGNLSSRKQATAAAVGTVPGCQHEMRTISNPDEISRAFPPHGLVGRLAVRPPRNRLKANGGRDTVGIKKEG